MYYYTQMHKVSVISELGLNPNTINQREAAIIKNKIPNIYRHISISYKSHQTLFADWQQNL